MSRSPSCWFLSLSLTDAAVRGRESPENVDPRFAGRNGCRWCVSQSVAMLNHERTYMTQSMRPGTARKKPNQSFWSIIKKEMWNVFVRCVHDVEELDWHTERWLSACDLISCHINMHEYGCYFIAMHCVCFQADLQCSTMIQMLHHDNKIRGDIWIDQYDNTGYQLKYLPPAAPTVRTTGIISSLAVLYLHCKNIHLASLCREIVLPMLSRGCLFTSTGRPEVRSSCCVWRTVCVTHCNVPRSHRSSVRRVGQECSVIVLRVFIWNKGDLGVFLSCTFATSM